MIYKPPPIRQTSWDALFNKLHGTGVSRAGDCPLSASGQVSPALEPFGMAIPVCSPASFIWVYVPSCFAFLEV